MPPIPGTTPPRAPSITVDGITYRADDIRALVREHQRQVMNRRGIQMPMPWQAGGADHAA